MICISLISLVLSTTTTLSKNPSSFTLNPGDSSTLNISYSIVNTAFSGAKGVTIVGSPKFLTYSGGSIAYIENTTTTGSIIINVNIPQNTSEGDYVNAVIIDEQTLNIPIHINQVFSPGSCKIYVLPGSFSKTLESGSQGVQIRDVYVSQFCESALTISTNSPQQIKPIIFEQVDGTVEPGQKFSIKVEYNTEGVSKGTYSDNVIINGVDEEENIYTLNLPISLTITGQISPNVNYSQFTSPDCSWSATELVINGDYKVVCSLDNPNIKIDTNIDTKYIKGTGVEELPSQWIYKFSPKATGNTFMEIIFKSNGATIDSISQELRISYGSTPLPGTQLKFLFYPGLSNAIPLQNITVLIVDNQTNSEVNGASLKLNGVLVGGINKVINLNSETEYTLRASAFGYVDLVSNISISGKSIEYTLPEAIMNVPFSISTIPPNVSIYLDGTQVQNPIIVYSTGNHTLKFTSSGYLDTYANLTILENIEFLIKPNDADLLRGGKQVFQLKEIGIWNVTYQPQDGGSPKLLNSGEGKDIEIKMSGSGFYYINVNDRLAWSYLYESKPFWKSAWVWIVFVLVIVIFSTVFLRNRRKDESSNVGFEMISKGG